MWYAIVGGTGLAVGIWLLIWALKERSARHSAERAADAPCLLRAKAEEIAGENVHRVGEPKGQLEAVEIELATLRGRLNEARVRLAECGDPQAVKKWLDDELGELIL